MTYINQKIFNGVQRKTTIILIVGIMAFTATTVFAGDPVPGLDISVEQIPGGEVSVKIYDSSLSTKSVEIVRMKIGDALLRYGIGGEDINKVTDALEGSGVYEAELKSFLINIGIDKNGINEIFATLDELGTGFIKPDDSDKAISIPDIEDITQEVHVIGDGFKSVSGMDSETAIQPATTEEPTVERVVNSFFDVHYELEVFVEVDKAGRERILDAAIKDVRAYADHKNAWEDLVLTIQKEVGVNRSDAERRAATCFDWEPLPPMPIPPLEPEPNPDPCGPNVPLEIKLKMDLIDRIQKTAENYDNARKNLVELIKKEGVKDEAMIREILAALYESIQSISELKARTGVAIPDDQAERVVRFKAGADLAKTAAGVAPSIEEFQDDAIAIIQNIRAAAPREREKLKEELQARRIIIHTEILSMSLKIRDNAEELRENFRERVRTTIGHVDHGKTARIANAHRQGLWMTYRFSSAMVRFDNIIDRLGSRVEKLEAQGMDTSIIIPLIEEAKNMNVGNEVNLERLKANNELFLLGENLQEVAKETREIAQELKANTQALHSKLRDTVTEIKKSMPAIGAQTILDIPDDFTAPYTPSTGTFGRLDTDLTQKISQSFMFNNQQTVTHIKVVVQDVNFPTDGIDVSIQTDNGSNVPSGMELASASKSRQELISAGVSNIAFTQITFNLGGGALSLSDGVKYWVVVARENEDPFDNSNYYTLRNYADIYPDGKQWNLVRCDSADVWIAAGLVCNNQITIIGGGGGPTVIGGSTGSMGDPPALVVLPGAGSSGGLGEVRESFDIDLELTRALRPTLRERFRLW